MKFTILIFLLPYFVRSTTVLLSRNRSTSMSSIYGNVQVGELAVDGNYKQTEFNICASTLDSNDISYWIVELPRESYVDYVMIYGRKDCCVDMMISALIEVLDMSNNIISKCGQISDNSATYNISCGHKLGSKIRIIKRSILVLCEVAVYGELFNQSLLSRFKPTTQSSTEQQENSALSADGNYEQNGQLLVCSQTHRELAFWMVDLEEKFSIDMVHIYSRMDWNRNGLIDARVELLSKNDTILHTCQNLDSFMPVHYISCSRKIGYKLRIRLMNIAIYTSCEVEVFGRDTMTLLSRGRATSQSSNYQIGNMDYLLSSYAVDGNYDQNLKTGNCSTTRFSMGYWMVDLGSPYLVASVKIYNRLDCCYERIIGSVVELLSGTNELIFQCGKITESKSTYQFSCNLKTGNKIRIRQTRKETLTLCEVEVFGPNA